MAKIFGNEIPVAGRFVSGIWVPAGPEEYRTRIVIKMPDGTEIPDRRSKRFCLHAVLSANRDPAMPKHTICLGTTDNPDEVSKLIQIAEDLTVYGAGYFFQFEILDAYQGLVWILDCPERA